MSFIKRAFLYVIRKKGKSTLLFFILLIMATFVLTGLSIGRATKLAQQDLRQSMGGSFHVTVDYTDNNPYLHKETVDEEGGSSGFIMYSTEQLSPEMIGKIHSIEGVKYCDAIEETLLGFEQLSLFPGTVPVDDEFSHSAKTVALWRSEEHGLFTGGTLTLSEGRHITEKDTYKVIICKDLADKSGLKLGDTLTVKKTNGKDIALEIVGLFTANETEKFGEQVTTYDKIQNRVFIDLSSAIAIEDGPAVQGFSEITVTVTDPENKDAVMQKVKSLPGFKKDGFTISADNEDYENVASSLKRMDKLVMSLLIVIMAVSVIILSLILTLWGKTRVHETGVFLAIGIKKIDIVGQYLAEVLLIAVLAFGFSFFSSNIVASNTANALMQQNIQKGGEQVLDDLEGNVSVEQFNDLSMNDSDGTDSGETDIQVSIGMEDILWLYLAGFVIIVISVAASSITVMQLKPQEILARMS